ncbi:uncharacterized protein LOC110985588 [Acanthaster planci]|uniref:Uncharacterized protein LOC110985588 n=1 Tax=Acanthaster planci TaxID=133434 RepID=A0A8B7Z9R0_ACAPL|nr:uncharacterized protein LOC110985588 [Acanthaster planci]XP_022102409.1 uncharacterized protein LOC110985588 [Acanthaster planci]
MADSSKASHKHELRQRLESMKRVYARTLRKVEKSEKAKRTRSHVHRVIAEQKQVGSSDASPSCTHSLRRTGAHQRPEESSVGAGALSEESVTNVVRKQGGPKSTMTTKRMQRKRRSVSFSIPKENASIQTSLGGVHVEITDSCLETSEICHEQQTKKTSPKPFKDNFVQAPAPSFLSCGLGSSIDNDRAIGTGGDRRQAEEVTLVPESQLTELSNTSFDERGCIRGTAISHLKESVTSGCHRNISRSGNDSQSSVQSDSHLHGAILQDIKELRPSEQPPQDTTQPNSEGTTHSGENDTENSCQNLTEVRTKRAGRKSRRRSRVPRQLTASDISFKEVVESQSTEEGSHTWIEGLMYPAEYYVRHTRSMTSSQCPQSQSNFDKADSQRYLDRDTTGMREKVISTENSDTVKDLCIREIASLTRTAGGKTLTSFGSVPESESDSVRSQLSESLLTVSAVQSMQKKTYKKPSDSVKSVRGSRNQRLQRKCRFNLVTSEFKTDTSRDLSTTVAAEGCYSSDALCTDDTISASEESARSVEGITSNKFLPDLPPACTRSDSTVKSCKDFCAVELLRGLHKAKLSQTEFALPEEDFGTLMLVKLQSNCAADTSLHWRNSENEQDGRVDHDVEKQFKIRDVTKIDCQAANKTKLGCESCAPSALTNVVSYQTVLHGHTDHARSGSSDGGEVAENFGMKTIAAGLDAPKCCHQGENLTTSPIQDLSPVSCKVNVCAKTASRNTRESQGRTILHSQLSPSQFHKDCSMAFPNPGCTPGWSPSCSPDADHRVHSKGDSPLAPCNKMMGEDLQRHQTGDSHKRLSHTECKATDKGKPSAIKSGNSKCNTSQCSPCSGLQLHVPDVSSQLSSKPAAVVCKSCTTECSTLNLTPAGGNVTPPNVIPEAAGSSSIDRRGNIQQTSPFAGVATATPPGRAEEPTTMSQCEVKISEDGDEVLGETEKSGRHELAFMGCVQHDLPWEATLTVTAITGGSMVMNEHNISLLAFLYQHTLVVWRSNLDTQEWQILKSWIIPQDEEFLCVRFMPCSKHNKVTLVVAGVFATCGIRMLSYDTVTEETQELDVDLAHSKEKPIQYVLCVTGEEGFAVAVKDNAKSALFLVHTCIESRNVQTVKSWTGQETSLTALLQVEGVKGMLLASTAHNNIMLWNYASGELIKEIPMKCVDSGSHTVCLKATAESGLLFVVIIFHDDVGKEERRCSKPIGAAVVLNPLTDKMAKLMEYQTSMEHAHANCIDCAVSKNTLLAKLSDGSLHQWEIFSGNLMNYSSSHPTNYSLRSAHLCGSQVVLQGSDQWQQVYYAR